LINSFEAACCGLRAAEQILTEAGFPVPAVAQVIAHSPSLVCGCDTLFVRPVESRNTTRANQRAGGGAPAVPGVFGGHRSACRVASGVTTFEVHLTRCVDVPDPLEGGDCADPGDCNGLLDCGVTPPARPADPCTLAPDKATETYWLLT
jgi:hypothetical protein